MIYSDLFIGQKHIFKRNITSKDVESFATITGDFNPIHLDSSFSKSTIFRDKIIHGMFLASLISKVIACDLPGPGSIYLSQEINFVKPVYHNSEITTVVEVTKLNSEKSYVYLNTSCIVDSIEVLNGNAKIKFMSK